MYRKYIKRILDLIFSIMLIIILLPIILLISLIIRIESKGPAFFKQDRTGYKGKKFVLYKFRSMVVNNDVYNLKKENEYTKVGKIIKRLSLDEIPQLINIIKGDMSFIGPRPWIVDYYQLMNKKQRKRTLIKPGLTGLAQVNGMNSISINKKIDYDLKYIDNVSFLLDLKIMFSTFKAVFQKKGKNATKQTIKEELDTLRKQNKKRK